MKRALKRVLLFVIIGFIAIIGVILAVANQYSAVGSSK